MRYLIGLFVMAAFLLVGQFVNRPVRAFLNGQFEGTPYWADHIFFMLTGKLIFALAIFWLFLNRKEAGLSLPTRPKQAYTEAVISGLVIVFLAIAALKVTGSLQLRLAFDFPLLAGNLFSNFYEEFIYRGVVFGVLLKFWKNPTLAAVGSAIVFCQGHLQYSLPLLTVVFISGIYWCRLTLKSSSILPAWVSHCVLDAVADSIL